ncbi:threonine/homoserine efflux transporter RhtA [Streptohalobacillus salinus]|uniref:Threonine/homoserine efflux transporter RhtA n=1 Tax=Streptohalobacillus salinus TaxID=621096 RepID=A0A2V3VYU3_9BACI|nr:DMT family transporter [Streptohalobacillus salinus]PXW87187.1 threonine/homoserine efflux transporter RhtA [Streptohalobacillus salinus]
MRIGGYGLVIVSTILWGIAGGLGGFLINKGWDPLVIAFYRGLVGLIFMVIWLIIRPARGNKKTIFWSILAGIGVTGNFAFYFFSMSESSIAVAATLMYTAPIFVFLLAFILGIERASLFKWLAIGFVMIGVVFLTEVYRVDAGVVTTVGLITGLSAGVSYALFIFSFKYATKYGQPPLILTLTFTTFIGLMMLVINQGEAIALIMSEDVLWVLLLGIIGAGLSFFLYVRGLRRTSPTVASVIAMVEPVTATLFGLFVMNEVLSWSQVVGMSLILVTVTVLSVKER